MTEPPPAPPKKKRKQWRPPQPRTREQRKRFLDWVRVAIGLEPIPHTEADDRVTRETRRRNVTKTTCAELGSWPLVPAGYTEILLYEHPWAPDNTRFRPVVRWESMSLLALERQSRLRGER